MPAKVHIVKAMVFPVVMWELDRKEGWAPKNWCFQTVVLEKTLESSTHPRISFKTQTQCHFSCATFADSPMNMVILLFCPPRFCSQLCYDIFLTVLQLLAYITKGPIRQWLLKGLNCVIFIFFYLVTCPSICLWQKKKKSISFQYERHKSKLVHPISKVGLQGVGLGFWIWEENNILILPFWDFAFQIIWRHWFIQRIWHGMLYLSA